MQKRLSWRSATASALALVLFGGAAAASATQPTGGETAAPYTVRETKTDIPGLLTQVAYDSASGRLFYAGTGEHADDITWFDTKTNEPSGTYWDLPAGEIYQLRLSPDAGTLYAATSGRGTGGNGKATPALHAVDTATGKVTTVEGTPSFPSDIAVDEAAGDPYVLSSKGVFRVDVAAGKVSDPIKFSDQKYPNPKGIQYDPHGKVLWVYDGAIKSRFLTAIDPASGTWLDSVKLQPGEETMPSGEKVGGNANKLALHPGTARLLVAMKPTSTDNWTGARIVQLDTNKRSYVGTPFQVPGNVTDIIFSQDGAHAFLATASKDYKSGESVNKLFVADLASSTATEIADFDALGITSYQASEAAGGGSDSDANTQQLALTKDGSALYVTHPFGSSRAATPFDNKLTIMTRTASPLPGGTAEPGAGDGEGTEEPGSGTEQPSTGTQFAWDGPDAPAPVASPATAKTLTNATLKWGISSYADSHAWVYTALSDSTSVTPNDFTFTGGTGWVDASGAHLQWGGRVYIQHYAHMNLPVDSKWGNFTLTADASGAGSLTADVWAKEVSTGTAGFKRVTLMTFTGFTAKEQDGKYQISFTPEWEGRKYTFTKNGAQQEAASSWPADMIDWYPEGMRAWWYTSGSSADADKAPATPVLRADAVAGTEEPGTEPGTEEPGTEEPGTEEPGTEEPGTEEPASPVLTLTKNSAAAGQEVTVSVRGLTSAAPVTFELHSDPVTLGTVTPEKGTATLSFAIPAGTPAGEHTVVALQEGKQVGAASLTIAADASASAAGGNAAATDSGTAASSAVSAKQLATTGAGENGLAAVASLAILLLLASAATFAAVRKH